MVDGGVVKARSGSPARRLGLTSAFGRALHDVLDGRGMPFSNETGIVSWHLRGDSSRNTLHAIDGTDGTDGTEGTDGICDIPHAA